MATNAAEVTPAKQAGRKAVKADAIEPKKLAEYIRAIPKEHYGVAASVPTPSMSEDGLFFSEVVSEFEAKGWTLDEPGTFGLRKSEIEARKGQTDDLYVFIR